MKYSAKTIRTLIRLRDGDAVNEGEFRSAQMKELLEALTRQNALSFVRIGKSRGAYKAITRERFSAACVDYDRTLSDLDAALHLAENEISSRAEIAMYCADCLDGQRICRRSLVNCAFHSMYVAKNSGSSAVVAHVIGLEELKLSAQKSVSPYDKAFDPR